MIGWRELLIVLVIVLLVFGTKRLANIGKDLGEGIKGFKKGLKDGQDAPPAQLGSDAQGDAADPLKQDSRKDA